MTDKLYVPGVTKPSVKVTVEIETSDDERVITLLEAALYNLKTRTEAERRGIGHDTKVFDFGHYTILHKVER